MLRRTSARAADFEHVGSTRRAHGFATGDGIDVARLHDATLCGSDAVNVMVSVHESSGLVKASYSGMSGCSAMRGGSATLGFQTTGGNTAKAFMVGYNAQVLDDNAPRQTMAFHPPN